MGLRITHGLEAVVAEAALEDREEVAQTLGLAGDLQIGQLCGLDGTATFMAQDQEHLDLQVVHRILQGPRGGIVETVASHADHEHVAQALIEDDLRGNARIRASEDSRQRELLRDEGSPLEGARPMLKRRAHPEARISLLQGREDLGRGDGLGLLVARVGLVAGLHHGEARGHACRLILDDFPQVLPLRQVLPIAVLVVVVVAAVPLLGGPEGREGQQSQHATKCDTRDYQCNQSGRISTPTHGSGRRAKRKRAGI
mmetsp:Transcript_72896/g.189793  ORF Transcript_72896/g.189793 Transcript_72896/m.189793 type:complete len:256 (+) Transcript_72896:636-1403(+)